MRREITTRTDDRYSIDATGDLAYPADLYRPHGIAETLDGWDTVDERHLELYRERGYLGIERAFDAEELDAALRGLLDLIGGRYPEFRNLQFEARARDRIEGMDAEERQDHVRKLMGFIGYDERLRAIAEHPALLRLVRRLLGEEELHLFQDMALFKPPGGGREKPWHQDVAFFDLRPDSRVVGAWIALDAATTENGCMHLVPSSHRHGPSPHFVRRDWQLCDEHVETERVVAAPLAPGGVLLFDGLLHHGTPANRSAHRRRSLQFHYAGASAERTDPKARRAAFGGDGMGVSC